MIFGEAVFSYSAIRERSVSVAAYFQEEGIRRGDVAVVLWDNGPEYAALFFGILMAGGTVVPLNPTNTEENIRFVVEHCRARFLAVTARALPLVKSWWAGPPIVTGNAEENGSTTDIETIFRSGAGPVRKIPGGGIDDLAMVLYTSGTTGKPKGVMLSHRNLETNTQSILSYLSLTASDRTLAVLPFYYSYGNSLLLTHARAGATLVVENGFAFVNRCLETMTKHRVTGFSGVPSHFALLLNRSRFCEMEWPHLRYMTCAGGGLPPVFLRRIRDTFSRVRFYVMYGQTEGAARLSSLDPDLVDRKIGSIGKGIPGVVLRVVDREGKDVVPGETGEIVAQGENIMKGYLGDPGATREVLKNGWLHTGDLATVDGDGYIFIKGRAKEFIKSGGYRISPQEIEEILLHHPSVAECAVVGVPDEFLGESIVAFVVYRIRSAASPGNEVLDTYLREKLPHYMVPQRIFAMGTLPKTESGKVKRVQLREAMIGNASG